MMEVQTKAADLTSSETEEDTGWDVERVIMSFGQWKRMFLYKFTTWGTE